MWERWILVHGNWLHFRNLKTSKLGMSFDQNNVWANFKEIFLKIKNDILKLYPTTWAWAVELLPSMLASLTDCKKLWLELIKKIFLILQNFIWKSLLVKISYFKIHIYEIIDNKFLW